MSIRPLTVNNYLLQKNALPSVSATTFKRLNAPLWGARLFARSSPADGCVPGTARILKGALSLPCVE
jgi:hypothetical protein